MSGAFVAVVGPSGSGKDAVIETARRALDSEAGFVFPRRSVTRPSSPGEDHEALSEGEFDEALHSGAFALTWGAHGLRYGIPAEVRDAVRAGSIVVANLSRTVLQQLPDSFPHVAAVRVTVPETLRLERIMRRGRESAEAAARRVARPDPAPDFPIDLEIVNDGTLSESAEQLVQFLEGLRASRPRVALS